MLIINKKRQFKKETEILARLLGRYNLPFNSNNYSDYYKTTLDTYSNELNNIFDYLDKRKESSEEERDSLISLSMQFYEEIAKAGDDVRATIIALYDIRKLNSQENRGIATIKDDFSRLYESSFKITKKNDNQLENIDLATRSFEEARDQIQNIGSLSKEKINRLKDVTKSVSQMIQSIERVTTDANEMSNFSDQSLEIAEVGEDLIDEVVNNIGEIKQSSSKTTQIISEFESGIILIGEIIEIIDDLSEQTHLLALNAAIEAVKAGENGRGFAVVADEVRNLAKKSKKATTQISDIIKQNTANIKNVDQSLSEGERKVKTGTNLIIKSKNLFTTISDTVKNISDQINLIHGVTHNMTDESKTVSSIISTLNNDETQNLEIINKITEESDSVMNSLHINKTYYKESRSFISDIETQFNNLSQLISTITDTVETNKSSTKQAFSSLSKVLSYIDITEQYFEEFKDNTAKKQPIG
jgi:methyl-accepting chemotaxis protein